jgi:hypothetical protein
VVLDVDGAQVLLHFRRIDQSEWGFLRHDDHNYGRNNPWVSICRGFQPGRSGRPDLSASIR